MYENHLNGKPVIESVAWIAEVLKGSKLNAEVLLAAHHEIDEMCDFLECSYQQTLLMVVFFYLKMEGSLPTANNMLKFLGVSSFKMLTLKNDLKQLVHKGLLRSGVQQCALAQLQWTYSPPEKVMERIICGVISRSN